MTIVIIDDEPPVALMLAESLIQEGHTVQAAATTEDGLNLIRRLSPDAVFLDIRMPGTSGVEVLRRIRAEWPEMQVIMVTGYAESPEADECRRLGAIDVVQKPTFLTKLGEALARIHPQR